jgi:hypothetical protein
MSFRDGCSCRWRCLALLAVWLTCAPKATTAQTASAPAVTAAVLFNFAKFAEWPAGTLSPGDPLVLCVADAPAVAIALEQVTASREAGGRGILVRRIGLEGPFHSCQLLYVTGLDERRAARLLAAAKDAPVLSVSDLAAFTRIGGIAHLFVEENRIRFAVNVDAVSRVQLRLSSRLLSLAVIVRDEPKVAQP